jgi:preprotein translocase subunit SecA
MVRKDKSDLVFLSEHDKFQAILEDIQDCVKRPPTTRRISRSI